MKNISILILFLLPLLAIVSCENQEKQTQIRLEQEQELFKKVMAGHDEVMPKTGKISQIIGKLKKYLKENEDLEPVAIAKITENIGSMQKAEEGMFEWMANFVQLDKLRETKSHEEIMQHLNKENEIMEKVKAMTDASLKEGLSLWDSLQPQ